jgi:hypothetical protein
MVQALGSQLFFIPNGTKMCAGNSGPVAVEVLSSFDQHLQIHSTVSRGTSARRENDTGVLLMTWSMTRPSADVSNGVSIEHQFDIPAEPDQ